MFCKSFGLFDFFPLSVSMVFSAVSLAICARPIWLVVFFARALDRSVRMMR
jgi:hypothetical protein